jgi:hypothetical protein
LLIDPEEIFKIVGTEMTREKFKEESMKNV